MVGTLARGLPLIVYFDDWSRMSKSDKVSSNHETMMGYVKLMCVYQTQYWTYSGDNLLSLLKEHIKANTIKVSCIGVVTFMAALLIWDIVSKQILSTKNWYTPRIMFILAPLQVPHYLYYSHPSTKAFTFIAVAIFTHVWNGNTCHLSNPIVKL